MAIKRLNKLPGGVHVIHEKGYLVYISSDGMVKVINHC